MDKKIKHIAIIIDGNRRYAKQHMVPSFVGHKVGLNKVEKSIQWLQASNIHEMTFYIFSIQNFKRSAMEKRYLFELFKQYCKKFLKENNKTTRIRFLGRLHLFPKQLQTLAKKVMQTSKKK